MYTARFLLKTRYAYNCYSLLKEMSSKVVETSLADGVLNNEEWVKRWDVKQIGFHQPVHASILDKKETEMFGGKTCTIFAPLCGKSLDLKWMYDKGHTVTGVEIAELACQEFFQENNIEYEEESLDKLGKLYKSKDGRIKLYAVDLYDITKDRVGEFDIIYDCRSLVAINLEDHKQYRDLMLSLMKKDGTYALMTVEYDSSIWPGPPHSINDYTVRELYGDFFNITTLQDITRDNPDAKKVEDLLDEEKPKSWGAASKMSCFVADRWYIMKHK